MVTLEGHGNEHDDDAAIEGLQQLSAADALIRKRRAAGSAPTDQFELSPGIFFDVLTVSRPQDRPELAVLLVVGLTKQKLDFQEKILRPPAKVG
jgi:hypothetical protein